MLIEVIHEETMAAAVAAAESVHPAADLVEFRLDPMADCDPEALVQRSPRPAILTCRSRQQGGAFGGSREDRARMVGRILRAKPAWVDLELGSGDEERLSDTGDINVILSVHLPEGSPGKLEHLYRQMAAVPGVEVLKVVPYADSLTDNLLIRNLLRLARHDGKPLAAFCMGAAGVISRIVAPRWGSWATYAASRPGRESAAGQLSMSQMTDLYGVHQMTRDTRLYGVLGHPLGHSLSPPIHNRAFREAGIDACYLPFETASLKEFLPLMEEMAIAGFSVTLPHKEGIVAHLDDIEPGDRPLGAVNTVVRRWNRFIGSNTDVPGALRALQRVTGIEGRTVALVGAGGAARALGHALRAEKAQVIIYNRTGERGRRLADRIGCQHAPLDEVGSGSYDILINATPVGMHPRVDDTPVAAESLRAGVVFDLVYNPAETRLLREARQGGARTVSGLDMFVEQAEEQFLRFTGSAPPAGVMRRAAEEALGTEPPGRVAGHGGRLRRARGVVRLAPRPRRDRAPSRRRPRPGRAEQSAAAGSVRAGGCRPAAAEGGGCGRPAATDQSRHRDRGADCRCDLAKHRDRDRRGRSDRRWHR
jgi:3-dehydroquinate dehydratase/shikimate dehydrogenase